MPDLAEQHIVIEVREHRRKFAELIPACRLYDFFAHA
jgi:hypothetical protein